jgi:hypothetical protein
MTASKIDSPRINLSNHDKKPWLDAFLANLKLPGAFLLWLAGTLAPVQAQSSLSLMSLSTDFEGGSAQVIEIDSPARKIHITPGGDATRGWICWWYFRLDNTQPGKPLTVEVSASNTPTRNQGKLTRQPLAAGWCLPQQAAVSHDGATWRHSAVGKREGNSIRYEIIPEKNTLWLAWGPPFTARDATELIAQAKSKIPGAQAFQLAQSRGGRPVTGLKVNASQDASAALPGVWIQARQHAWESGSSWVARGLVEWLATDDVSARWLRENTEIVVIPIMDVDNANTGNGGKEEDPRDHNRDWDVAPVYPEVTAAQQSLQNWSKAGRLDYFIDLHNPAPNDPRPFFFTGPPDLLSDRGRENRALFLDIAHKHIQNPLAVEPNPRLTGPSYHPLWRKISGQWVTDHGNDYTVAVCLETSWNTPHSTTEGYRAVGSQLGAAISEYLRRRRK